MPFGSRSNPYIPGGYGFARKKRPDIGASPPPPPPVDVPSRRRASSTPSRAPSRSTPSRRAAVTRVPLRQLNTLLTPSAPAPAKPKVGGGLDALLDIGETVGQAVAGSPGAEFAEKAAKIAREVTKLAALPDSAVQSGDVGGRRTLGKPTVEQLVRAATKDRVRVNKRGKITIPATRKAVRQLAGAKRAVRRSGRIEGITHGGEARQFAEALSKASGLDPRFVGAWVQAEGGGFAGGGEAGRNNWLGVGYPGAPTPFGRSGHFAGSGRQAGRATAEWMKGRIGDEFGYGAAPGIEQIIPKAAGKGPQAALKALAESGWGTNVESVAQNLASIRTSSPNPKAAARFRQAKAQAQRLGIPTQARQRPGQQTRKTPTIVQVGLIAQKRFGLSVGEHPAFGGVEPVHTGGSFHYRGQAIDVSGDAPKLAAFNKFVATRFGDQLAEMFYDPGINIDNGVPVSPIGGHPTHVHVAIDEPGTKAHGLVTQGYGLSSSQPVGYYGSGGTAAAARESAQRAKAAAITPIVAPTSARASLPAAFQQFQLGAEPASSSAGELDIIEQILRRRRV